MQLPAATTGENRTGPRYLVIGDSVSMGMQSRLATLMAGHGWAVSHNPGNGDNTNFGAHCILGWLGNAVYDVISFQFGLHDIAYDEERLSVQQYTERLRDITDLLVRAQRLHGTKLLWVKTTPVPTVPTWGPGCLNASCLNPARFDSDVRLYNAAAEAVMADHPPSSSGGIETADLYSFVLAKCGGLGYSRCPGFQLPANVHFTDEGWTALAAEMERVLLGLAGSSSTRT